MLENKLILGLVQDKSHKYDGFNWHDKYAEICGLIKIEYYLLNFDSYDWENQLNKSKCNVILWRPWHVPWDKKNAKNKIYYIDQILGKKILPDWNMYWHYDDKIAQLYLMNKLKIPHPLTFCSYSLDESMNFAKKIKVPIVWKSSDGAMGSNVSLINSRGELLEKINQSFNPPGIKTFYSGNYHQCYVYLQEYIHYPYDYRIIIIGNEVALAYKRISNNFHKNVSLGAKIESDNIPQDLLRTCKKYSKLLKMDWCAFDAIPYNDNYAILEFSSVFGFASSGVYEEIFGCRDGGVWKKQIEYIVSKYGI